MSIKKYEDLNSLELDILREIGSIGTGNAATALSGVLSKKVEMTLPNVNILGFNEAVKWMGGPENIVAGVLVRLSGDINGIMLYIQKLDFINVIVGNLLSKKINDYNELTSMDISALIEVGNIIISSYVNAISTLTDVDIKVTVPDMSINMLGGILTVPMIEYGYSTNKILCINGNFVCDDKKIYSNLLLLPDIKSLDYLLKKLGVENG